MNERIRELAKEAIANVRFWNAEKEAYDVGHDELKKFAELIVRECADLFEVEYGESEISGNQVATVLKEHFGVKR